MSVRYTGAVYRCCLLTKLASLTRELYIYVILTYAISGNDFNSMPQPLCNMMCTYQEFNYTLGQYILYDLNVVEVCGVGINRVHGYYIN